jgi:K+-sensing histidine kinase KdpD
MTGGDHPDLGRQALRAGAHDFIGKSWISTSALARAMDNAAERWQMDRELREQRVVLQQQAERDVYFLRLGEAMRHYSDPADLKQAMVQWLGRHLQASRVVLWQFQKDDWAVVDQCYSDGESQFEGRYPLDDFVRLLFAKLRAGHNVISADIQNDPDYSPAQKAACEALQLAAHLSVPIFSDGELLGVIGVYQCRPRRWTENEVELVKSTARRMNDTVSRALAQRRLRDSEQLLLEESRHKDEFLATLAHELRNPLAPIRNGLAFLQRQALPAPAIATIHMMDRQLTQMVHLVDDLLDVSRIRLGKIVLRRELLSVSDILTPSLKFACHLSTPDDRH